MGITISLPKYQFYLAPTSQSSWSKRPFHVSLSSSLWTDLLMVAMLFRLNEFTIAHLTSGIEGFWLPIAVFFAIYDTWETRVLFDSVFMYQDDIVHQILGIVSWLLLALMATTVTPTPEWRHFDALLFSGLKFSHQTIRMGNYLETWRFSRSKRARKAARVRSIVYTSSYPLYLAVPCILGTTDISPELASILWVAGFLFQRIVWAYLKWDPQCNSKIFSFQSEITAIKTNIPFKTARYGDWNMLQLGAIVLGFMTVPTTSLGSYGTLIFGYMFIACLNLLSYSMAPEDPEQHALVKGGWREFIWLELFSLGGISFVGIAVGLRVHLFYPSLVILDRNRHFTWLLCFCAFTTTMVMFGQEYCHGGQIARLNGGRVIWLKVFLSSLNLVVAGAWIGSNVTTVAYINLGLAIISFLILFVQVFNGAFKRQIWKNNKTKLMGHFRAAVIGMVLLTRARRNIAIRHAEEGIFDPVPLEVVTAEDGEDSPETDSFPSTQEDSQVQTGSSFNELPVKQAVSFQGPSKAVSTNSFGTPHAFPVRKTFSTPTDSALEALRKNVKFTPPPGNDAAIDAYRKTRGGRRSTYESRKREISVAVKRDVKIVKVLLNERVYTKPHVFQEGNKATKYKVQWSDLFFDVLFVGVVFRLGDLLLAGIGAGFSEVSIHYLPALGSNETVFDIPHEEARSDAIFIFGSVFVAVWAMWHNKLAYGSKVGTGDVLHKVIEMVQGLSVLICAVNITTPALLQDSTSGNAYIVTSMLLAFQLSMVLLWCELFFSTTDSRARGTALRNIQRDSVTLIPLLCSYATIATNLNLSITTLLWACSWLFPFLMRVFVMKYVNETNAVRDLHRYVIHRLGDGALIVLGEGVLQIIRAETDPVVFTYLAVALALFIMTAVRIALYSMDCFAEPQKHAQLLSLDAGLAAYFIRSLAAPALVAMGVSIKKMVSITHEYFDDHDIKYYFLLCGASTISCFTFVVTYDLHRFAYHRRWRHREFVIMLFLSSWFVLYALIPAPTYVILALVLLTWLIVIFVHFLLDDYFLLKERAKNNNEETSRSLKRNGSEKSYATAKTRRFTFMTRKPSIKLHIPSFFFFRSSKSKKERNNTMNEDLPEQKVFYPLQDLGPTELDTTNPKYYSPKHVKTEEGGKVEVEQPKSTKHHHEHIEIFHYNPAEHEHDLVKQDSVLRIPPESHLLEEDATPRKIEKRNSI